MPFAPRPLKSFPYILPASEGEIILKTLKSKFLKQSSPHKPITSLPLCYKSNTEILSSLGFEKAIPHFLKDIEPGKPFLTPDEDLLEINNPHFLQIGIIVSRNADTFIFEMGERHHSVGLLFCHTPTEIASNLEEQGFKAGRWMLDQVVFNQSGQDFNLLYGQNTPQVVNVISDLLKRVSDVSHSLENDYYDDTSSMFVKKMYEFYEQHTEVLNLAKKPLALTAG